MLRGNSTLLCTTLALVGPESYVHYTSTFPISILRRMKSCH